MASWHSIESDNYVETFNLTEKLFKAFDAYVLQTGHSLSGAAVFSRKDLETNVTIFYFTPSVELLATAFRAVPCEKPVPDPEKDFGFVVGNQDAWEVHFPGFLAKRKLSKGGVRN